MKKANKTRFNWLEAALNRETAAPEPSQQESSFVEGYVDKLMDTLDKKSPGFVVSNEFKEVFNPSQMYATLTDPVIRRSPLELLDLKDAAMASLAIESLRDTVRAAVGAETKGAEGSSHMERKAPDSLEALLDQHRAGVALDSFTLPENNPFFKDELNDYAQNAKQLGEALRPMSDFVQSITEIRNLVDLKNQGGESAPLVDIVISHRLHELSTSLQTAGFENASTYLKGEALEYQNSADAQQLALIGSTLSQAYFAEKEQLIEKAGLMDFVEATQSRHLGFESNEASQRVVEALSVSTSAPEASTLGGFSEESPKAYDLHGMTSAVVLDVALSMAKEPELAVVSTESSLSDADVAYVRELLGPQDAASFTDQQIRDAISSDNLAFAQASEVSGQDVKDWVEVLKLDAIDGGRDPEAVSSLEVLSAGLTYLNDKDFYNRDNLNLENEQVEGKSLPDIHITDELSDEQRAYLKDASPTAEQAMAEGSEAEAEAETELE